MSESLGWGGMGELDLYGEELVGEKSFLALFLIGFGRVGVPGKEKFLEHGEE